MIFDGAIDAHVHLWDPARCDDILILKKEPRLGPLGQTEALRKHLRDCAAAGALLVQSAPDVGHSDWLRAAARGVGVPLGLVGWIEPAGPEAERRIAALIEDPWVCGVRLMLNRMDAPAALLDRAALEDLSQLAAAGLALECLAPPECLADVAALARALPEAQIVLDHCGLPPVPPASLAPWQQGIKDLAGLPNVSVKFSGLMEPFGPEAHLSQVEDRAAACLDLFGPGRLMAASNHPVCAMAGGAARWSDSLERIIARAGLDMTDRTALLRGTALRVFGRLADIMASEGETICTS